MRKRKVERRTVTFGMPANQSPLQDWTYTIIKDYAPGDTVLVEFGIPISVGPEELKRLNREFRALSKATKGAHKRPKKLGALSNRLGDHMHLIRGARAVSTHDPSRPCGVMGLQSTRGWKRALFSMRSIRSLNTRHASIQSRRS